MDPTHATTAAAAVVVVVTLVLTGPLVGTVDVGAREDGLGDGTATVDAVSLAHDPAVTPGRFGTGVVYLRIPDAETRLSAVEGRSRLVYAFSVPALGFERVGNRQVTPGSPESVSVGMADRAFPRGQLDRDRYTAVVEVRIQSFAVDRTVYADTVTVEVRTDG
jgi:hypothetical protein